MGPTIILDKSALQALSQSEINFLFKHYYVVVPPILPVEILGDLEKTKGIRHLSKDEVTQLSKKLLSMDSVINGNYKALSIAPLLGYDIPMIGQAVVTGGVSLETRNGKKIDYLDQTTETGLLIKWQSGVFSDVEEEFAKQWRDKTKALNLEDYKVKVKALFKKLPKINNFNQLIKYVDNRLLNPNPAIRFLSIGSFMNEMRLPQALQDRVYNRWLEVSMPSFNKFAPYSYYCFRVKMIFEVGLATELISTRSTNLIDLEYLYYLPFCNVFSSGDNLHKNLCPLLLRDDQNFIDRDILKKDLSQLHYEWQNLSDEERKQRAHDYGSYPPMNPESVTYQLWKRHMKPWKPGSGNLLLGKTKEEEKEILKKLQPFQEAIDEYHRKKNDRRK